MDIEKWRQMEELLDRHQIKPLVSVIPACMDHMFTQKYIKNETFWELAENWQKKGWDIALHGYNHVYTNFNAKGLNPVNNFSEFVGLPYAEQAKKIRAGIEIFKKQGIHTDYFVAPGHSFDENTLLALKNESDIRIISDTVASDVYYDGYFWFIPQQCGAFRHLPCRLITGCYHPNSMTEKSFEALDAFLRNNRDEFTSASELCLPTNKKTLYDRIISKAYFQSKRIHRRGK